jgi:hypothetical protein
VLKLSVVLHSFRRILTHLMFDFAPFWEFWQRALLDCCSARRRHSHLLLLQQAQSLVDADLRTEDSLLRLNNLFDCCDQETIFNMETFVPQRLSASRHSHTPRSRALWLAAKPATGTCIFGAFELRALRIATDLWEMLPPRMTIIPRLPVSWPLQMLRQLSCSHLNHTCCQAANEGHQR